MKPDARASADAEFARRHNLRHVRVTGKRELRAQRVDVEPLPLRKEERVRREERLRREAIEGGLRGDERDVAFASRDTVEHRQPFGNEILMRREMVVRQRLPIGEDADRERRREPCDLGREACRRERVGTDDDEHSPLRARFDADLCQRERIGRSRERRQCDPLAVCGQFADERRQRRKRIYRRSGFGDGFAKDRKKRGGGRRSIGGGRRHARSGGA